MSTYLYRLDVTYPEGSQEPGWEPPGWQGYEFSPYDDKPFQWPGARNYLSLSGARKRAKLLESLGATAIVVRSLPVQWPEVTP